MIGNMLTASPSAATSSIGYINPVDLSETVSLQVERGTSEGRCARQHFQLVHEIMCR